MKVTRAEHCIENCHQFSCKLKNGEFIWDSKNASSVNKRTTIHHNMFNYGQAVLFIFKMCVQVLLLLFHGVCSKICWKCDFSPGVGEEWRGPWKAVMLLRGQIMTEGLGRTWRIAYITCCAIRYWTELSTNRIQAYSLWNINIWKEGRKQLFWFSFIGHTRARCAFPLSVIQQKWERERGKVGVCVSQIDRTLVRAEWDDILLLLMQNTNIWAEDRRLLSLRGPYHVFYILWPLFFPLQSGVMFSVTFSYSTACWHLQSLQQFSLLLPLSTLFISLLIYLKPCHINSVSHGLYTSDYLFPLSYSEKSTSW